MEKNKALVVDKEFTEHRQAMRELDFQIRSNRPLIYICTHEENRIMDAIRGICARDNRKKWELYGWDLAAGLQSYCDVEIENGDGYDEVSVLDWFSDQTPNSKESFQILVLNDYHKLIGSDGSSGMAENRVIRELKNQSYGNIAVHKCIILMGTSLFLPPELEKICAVIDWPLPERYHIADEIATILESVRNNKTISEKFQFEYTNSEMDDIISAFQGLTIVEIKLLCSYMVLTTDKFDAHLIASKKRDIIRKSGLVDWIDTNSKLDSIGGLYELKNWLIKRRHAFTNEAKEYGLPENPKGLLLVGVQGAGKSLSAQAIASFWNLPLLRLDMGKVFSGIVGSSEENIRSVIKVAESISPCVVWFDEIDKGLSGTGSSNNTDGGTAARVFGSLLNWMQEKNKPVYIAATANDVSQLPPELLRKGRFDEIFFVDLPSPEERAEIWKIHIEKRGRKVSKFDVNKLVEHSEGFTGAEIESAIIAAMYESFDDNKREPLTKDIVAALQDTVAISVTMKEKIEKLRKWAETRARNASTCRKSNYNKHAVKEYVQKTEEDDEDL